MNFTDLQQKILLTLVSMLYSDLVSSRLDFKLPVDVPEVPLCPRDTCPRVSGISLNPSRVIFLSLTLPNPSVRLGFSWKYNSKHGSREQWKRFIIFQNCRFTLKFRIIVPPPSSEDYYLLFWCANCQQSWSLNNLALTVDYQPEYLGSGQSVLLANAAMNYKTERENHF